MLFVVGVNTALRISDALRLRIGDLLDEKRRIRRRFWIREQKRGKRYLGITDAELEAVIQRLNL